MRENLDPTEDCDGCMYWSERCAMAMGCDPLKALCFCVDSPYYQKMVYAGCGCYKSGRAVDDPAI